MSGRFILLALLAASAAAQSTSNERAYLTQLAREANEFTQKADGVHATETLVQTRLNTSQRARRGVPYSPILKRTIVSDYVLLGLGGAVQELRIPVSVDGKAIKQSDSLRNLAAGIAPDDAGKRKALESFEKHGLSGTAVDMAQILSLFAGGNNEKFDFIYRGKQKASDDTYDIFRFQQLDGPQGLTIYRGGKPVRQKLAGEIWFHEGDGIPLRVALDSEHDEDGVKVRDVAAVDYESSDLGLLLPTRIVHQQFRDQKIHVEDAFEYSNYHRITPNAK